MNSRARNIKNNFHLLLTGISFLIYSTYILTASIDYFFRDKFFEGFVLVVDVVMFAFISLLLLIPYLIKKDYKRLGFTAAFVGLMTLLGFCGFFIPLALIPPLSLGLATYFFNLAMTVDLKRERNKNTIANIS